MKTVESYGPTPNQLPTMAAQHLRQHTTINGTATSLRPHLVSKTSCYRRSENAADVTTCRVYQLQLGQLFRFNVFNPWYKVNAIFNGRIWYNDSSESVSEFSEQKVYFK